MAVLFATVTYTNVEKRWLDKVGKHYLQNAPPGALFAVGVFEENPGLFGEPVAGKMVGLCVCGRPTARMIPQDGSVVEITRLVLLPGCPYGTASECLRFACSVAKKRGAVRVISYHDRSRHTGCIYKKAGFKRDWVTDSTKGTGWQSRGNVIPTVKTKKRRWAMDLNAESR